MSEVPVNLLINVTLALSHRYFVGCTVVLHPQPPGYIPPLAFEMYRTLVTNLGHQGRVSFRSIKTYHIYFNGQVSDDRCSRIMHVLYGTEALFKEPFAKLTHQVSMAGPLWLLFLDQETIITEFLKDVNAPFDVDMVVVQLLSNGTVELNEVYRASVQHPIRVVPYGSFTEQAGLESPDHVSLYYRRWDMEGVQFKVGLASTFPLVNIIRLPNERLNVSGFFIEVWRELERRLNFTTEYSAAADNKTGVLKNGRWNGVMGMVAQKQVDVGITSLTITPERSRVVEFLRPLLSTRNQLFFRKPGLEIQWNTILRPFGMGIWLTLLAWVFVSSSCLWMFLYVGVRFGLEKYQQADEYTWINCIFLVAKAFSQQGSSFIPQTSSTRMLFITSYLVAVVVLTAYSGVLISFVAVEIPREPFSSLPDLLRDESYTFRVLKDSGAYMYFANSTDRTLTAVYKRWIEPTEKTMLASTTEQALSEVCYESKIVFFAPQASTELSMYQLNDKGCNIMMLRRPLNRIYQSIIIQKKNQYRDALNHHLDMMNYHGILGRIRKRILQRLDPLHRGSVIEVGYEQLIEIYMVFIAGFIVALTLFIVERFYRRRGTSGRSEKQNKCLKNQLFTDFIV